MRCTERRHFRDPAFVRKLSGEREFPHGAQIRAATVGAVANLRRARREVAARVRRSIASSISRVISAVGAQARRLPHLRVHRDGGEAGDGVHLVHVEGAGIARHEEVDARHARTARARGRSRPPACARAPWRPAGARPGSSSSRRRDRRTSRRRNRSRPCGGRRSRRGSRRSDRRCPAPRTRSRARRPRARRSTLLSNASAPRTARRGPPGAADAGHADGRAGVGRLHEQRIAEARRSAERRRRIAAIRRPP